MKEMLCTTSGPSEGTQLDARDALRNLWTFSGRTTRCKEEAKEMLWTVSGPSEGAQPGEGTKEMLWVGLWTYRERAQPGARRERG